MRQLLIQKWIAVGIGLILATSLAAQIDPDSLSLRERVFKFTPGYGHQQGRDKGMSPLIYSGNHIVGAIGLEKIKNGQFNTIDLSAMFGRMRPPTQPKPLRSTALALRLQMDFSHQRLLQSWSDGQMELFAGGSFNNLLNVLFHQRYLNNSLNYAFSSSVGPSGRFHYHFKIKQRSFRAYTQLQIPFVAFNLRPSYVSSIPEGYIAQERSDVRAFFDSGQLQTLNRFFRLRNEIGLFYMLKNENQVVLSYTWDYYSMTQEHPVQMAVHQILLGWRYSF